ncbi:BMP family ABC transporter substrate-binding protein [Beijerinckia sp. L45]|uniref:BMP family ABC transporter substrate-binding protein n=1 Tax=Beijerinckia sp. L45 TaxID=1641855 RepID=UPI00131E349F|nr:BMP family ABC transporter substrate-binding protein [Beijerinckia sp. L45]
MINRRHFNAMLGGTAGFGAGIRPANAAATPKIGFVYLGPVGDYGWTYQHEAGRKEVVSHFGDTIETTFVENVPETADAERVIAALANKGHSLIFTTSFGYMNPTAKVAAMKPAVKFEHCSGYKHGPNLGVYTIRFYEARYIHGVIAGKMSKTGTIGYIASVPIPQVIMCMNATLLGMRSVNPNAKLKFIFINTWYDPGKEGDAAKALLDQGCDIIAQHTDSPAALQVCEQRGVKAFAEATDMIKFAPNTQLTGPIDNWGPYYVARVQALLDGTWKTDDVWGGLGVDMLKMAPYRNMPDDVAALASKTEAGLKAGTIIPFSGDLKDQAGKAKTVGGKPLDDAAINSMNWLVEGVEGSLPT